MFKKKINNPFLGFKALSEKRLFLLLFAVAFFLRFPFFFRDYVDHDESTFILMGQAWVDGFLPYTQLWDLKPPLTFLFFAILIKLFGKSFIAIRLAGTLLVTITAFFTCKMGNTIGSKKNGVIAALLCVVFLSMFGSLQGVMSEHISICFFVVGVYLFLFKKLWYSFLLAGVLFGCAAMTKLNLAYPFFLLALYQLLLSHQKKQLFKLTMVGLAMCFVIIMTALPYYLDNSLDIWWKSVIEAPLAYGNEHKKSTLKTVLTSLFIFSLILIGYKKGFYHFKDEKVTALFVIIIGILISFIQAGKINSHYLIQLYPFICILVLIACNQIPYIIRLRYPKLLLLLIILLPIEAYLEYANIIKNKTEKGTFFNGEGFDVPRYFVSNGLNTKSILFLRYHIGYWVLDEYPLTKVATHPSNILRETLHPYIQDTRWAPHEELRHIMEDIRPVFIVIRKNRRVFDKAKYVANFYMQLQLLKNYAPLDTIDNAVIHQRLEMFE